MWERKRSRIKRECKTVCVENSLKTGVATGTESFSFTNQIGGTWQMFGYEMKFRVLSVIKQAHNVLGESKPSFKMGNCDGNVKGNVSWRQKFTQLIRIAKISTRSSSEICLHHPETKSKVKAFKLRMRKKFIVVNLEVGHCRSLLRTILIDSEQWLQ